PGAGLQRERQPELLHPLVGLAGHRVGRHQDTAFEGEVRMQDPVGGGGRYLVRHGGLAVGHQIELAAQDACVEAHRLGTGAIEVQVCVELGHLRLLSVSGFRIETYCGYYLPTPISRKRSTASLEPKSSSSKS